MGDTPVSLTITIWLTFKAIWLTFKLDWPIKQADTDTLEIRIEIEVESSF